MDKILILGGSGLVGKALIDDLKDDYDLYGTYYEKAIALATSKSFKFDVEKTDILDILEDIEPKYVISCLRGDFKAQLLAHETISRYLKHTGGKLYYCSTANVFDADITKGHYENYHLSSESDYGKFKISCESIIRTILKDQGIIFRLPMVWGLQSPRLKLLKKQLDEKEDVVAYTNLYFNNTTDVSVAKHIHYAIKNDLRGVYHLGSSDVMIHELFIRDLIQALSYDDYVIKQSDFPTDYYLALHTRKLDYPNDYTITNKDIITYLVQ